MGAEFEDFPLADVHTLQKDYARDPELLKQTVKSLGIRGEGLQIVTRAAQGPHAPALRQYKGLTGYAATMAQLDDLLDGLRWRRTRVLPPAVVKVPLYAVAVAAGADGAQDVCAFTTTRTSSRELSISIGILGLKRGHSTTQEYGKTLTATPGRLKQLCIEARVDLEERQLYEGDRPLEPLKTLPCGIHVVEPWTYSTEALDLPPTTGTTHDLLRSTDPEETATTWVDGEKDELSVSLTIPIPKLDDAALGVSITLGSAWEATHQLTLPAGRQFTVSRLADRPGTLLRPSR